MSPEDAPVNSNINRDGTGGDVAVVYGASSSWPGRAFHADFDAGLHHGGFFADLAGAAEGVGEGLSRAKCIFACGYWKY